MSGFELLSLVAAPFALAVLGALVATETALTRIGRARAEALSEDGAQRSVLRQLVDDRIRILGPLWSLIVLVQFAIAAAAAVIAVTRWSTWAIVPAVALAWLVVWLVTAAARSTALGNLDSVAKRLAVRVGSIVARPPLVWLGLAAGLLVRGGRQRGESTDHDPDAEGVSESQLLALTELAAEEQAIDADEQELIESSLAFGDITARQVMVPRPDMVTATSDMSAKDVLELVVLHGFSRFPVTGDSIDNVVGVVHDKDLMAALLEGAEDQPVEELMRECRVVPETKQIAKLLREMQSQHSQIAVVIDEYGGTAGMCTLEDIIEEIVGEIADEFDVEEPLIESLGTGAVRVNGKATLDELNDLIGVRLPKGEWSTVGGLIFNTLGYVPARGETLLLEEHRLVVEHVDGSRIARVLIEHITPGSQVDNTESS